MNLPDKCPFCGADTPAGDWKRWPVSPGVNLDRELALARARIARLEEAGDEMADWNMNERNLGCDPELAHKWHQAKEAKPCPHCLRVECECSEFDVAPDMGDK